MGIRFACPNGHKLNVKAEFAGKRAICPHCNAKVLVPANAATRAEASEPTPDRVAPDTSPPPAPVDDNPPPAPPAPRETTWYVRIGSGEQFGPADAQTMRQWIEDGRVSAENWVWRTGWDDWQKGSVAIAELAVAEGSGPASLVVAPADSTGRAPTGEASPGSAAAQRRRKLDRRKRRTKKITLALVLLTVVLAIVLVVVLARS